MRGNEIVVTPEPMGRFMEGYVASGQTIYPGSVAQIDHTADLQGGRHTFKLYDADGDGGRPKGPIYIVLNEPFGVKIATEAYTSGERIFLYTPLPGDELNLLISNLTGTADDHAEGEMLIIDDTTGEFIATTGTPETECAQLLETITDPTADTLAWCKWTGY